MAIGLVSCSDELYRGAAESGKVAVRFKVGVPAAATAGTTRALGDMSDPKRKNLNVWLVVFDEEGFLVETAMACQQANQGDETTFSVMLSRSTERRIIHFVAVDFTDADTDGDGINDSIAWNAAMKSLPYGHETEVIRVLKVPYPIDAYWQRKVVKSIHDDTKMTRVPLVRNFAQVVIEPGRDNEGNSTLQNFTIEGYAVCNVLDAGTVAPYNTSDGNFVDYLNGEESKNYAELHYHGVEATGSEHTKNIPRNDGTPDGGLLFDMNPKYLYESVNSIGESKGKVYVIVKGRYSGNGGSNTTTYYKVDLVKKGTSGMEYYDVLRNILYKGRINSVVADGYSSAYLASQAAASNNISSSTTTEGVPNISDSKQRIFVSTTFIVMTQNKPVTMKYKYIPDLAGGDVWNNAMVKYNDALSFASLSNGGQDDSDGWRTLTITPDRNVPKGGAIEEDTLHFYVNTGNPDDEVLSRDVRVIYREPYKLDVVCPPLVSDEAGKPVTVTLHVAKDFNEKVFPLTFLIETSPKSLYPDVSLNSLPVQTGKSLADGTTNSFWYEKTITWDDYQALEAPDGKNYKVLPCHFLTNSSDNAATVYAYNEYCNLAMTSFINPPLRGVALNGAQYYGKNQRVTLNIDIKDATLPLTIKVQEGTNETLIDWQSGQTSYTYLTKTFGEKITATVLLNGTDESVTASKVRNTIASRSFTTNISSQTVTIRDDNNTQIGTGTMDSNGFTSDVELTGTIDENTMLTFTYRDWWLRTYTAKARLSDLLNGATLNFQR